MSDKTITYNAPCKKCNTYERYRRSNDCVECTRRRALKQRGYVYTDEQKDQLSRCQSRVKELEHELKQLRPLAQRQEAASLDREKIRRQVFGLAQISASPPDWVLHGERGGSAPGIPVTVWSDWHWGEVVSSEETYGLNEFNTKIATKRIQRLVDRTVDLCIHHMVRPEYPGVVVCLGGDMISGNLHEELAESDEGSPVQQVTELLDPLVWALSRMADEFGNVFVPCVSGNHGRLTRKPRMKAAQLMSYDWLLYTMLEREFKNDDRVQFYVPSGTDALFRVYDHRFLLTHGDRLGVKGGDGIIGAIGPIMRGRVKVGLSEAQVGRDFDTLVTCHWHQYMQLEGLVVNGSLIGYNEYARLALRSVYQRPTQAMFFVHNRYGITARWPVFLSEHRRRNDHSGQGWVSWKEN